MIKVQLDNINYDYDDINEFNNYTVLQFALYHNINIPCFCYYERLSIAGNCRMCLVQINNGIGASCAINIAQNMIIYTNNLRTREARESVLEFLLINHPLDCPICDQGGECDLQDLSLIFGSDRGRFYENKKRSVDNFSQNGPLIKTIMTRCIHCTRCVRYANEVSEFALGVLDRGFNMEIGTYYNINLLDELSGNIIDLCPVGALTSMPYAFKIRPWEVIYYNNIDFLDSLCSSIRLHIYSNKIIRILPLLDETINEEWISNKTRFSYDALYINRNYYPKLKFFEKFIVLSWDYIINFLFLYLIKYIYLYKDIVGFVGYYIDLSSCLALKTFFLNIGSINIIYNDNFKWLYDFNLFIFFNNLLDDLECIKFFLFIACDLRLESPLLNIRLKKNYNINKNNELFFSSFGLALKYSLYPIKNLGNSINKLLAFVEGKIRYFSNYSIKEFLSLSFFNILYFFHNKSLLIIGNSLLMRNDSVSLLFCLFKYLNNKFSLYNFNLINSFIGFFSYSNIIYNQNNKLDKYIGFIYNLKGDHINDHIIDINKSFIINQNFLNNYINCNMVLPIAGPYETDNLYLNLEGRYRLMKQNLKIYIGLYSNWEIISLLNLYKKKNIKLKIYYFINFYNILNYFKFILNYFCNFYLILNKFYLEFFYFTGYIHNITNNNKNILFKLEFYHNVKILNNILFRFINNYYNTDFLIRNSKVMSFSSLKKYIIFK